MGLARATIAGTFRVMPAHAERMYAPEVSGRMDGGVFVVEAADLITDKQMASFKSDYAERFASDAVISRSRGEELCAGGQWEDG
jgi:hypothetical protein